MMKREVNHHTFFPGKMKRHAFNWSQVKTLNAALAKTDWDDEVRSSHATYATRVHMSWAFNQFRNARNVAVEFQLGPGVPVVLLHQWFLGATTLKKSQLWQVGVMNVNCLNENSTCLTFKSTKSLVKNFTSNTSTLNWKRVCWCRLHSSTGPRSSYHLQRPWENVGFLLSPPVRFFNHRTCHFFLKNIQKSFLAVKNNSKQNQKWSCLKSQAKSVMKSKALRRAISGGWTKVWFFHVSSSSSASSFFK